MDDSAVDDVGWDLQAITQRYVSFHVWGSRSIASGGVGANDASRGRVKHKNV